MQEQTKDYLNTPSAQNTLSHELLARDEQNVGIFFASFAIQYYLHKEMLSVKLNHPPKFLDEFQDVELYASQRVFIKNIIGNKKYKTICEEIEGLLLEYNDKISKKPHDIFLLRLNKSFLIRQIFGHSQQLMEKYRFVRNFIGKEINEISDEELLAKMWHLPVEQQVLVCAAVFSNIKDNFGNKKKTIADSFIENAKRLKNFFITMGKQGSIEFYNMELILKHFSNLQDSSDK